jgi:hypothetical protein
MIRGQLFLSSVSHLSAKGNSENADIGGDGRNIIDSRWRLEMRNKEKETLFFEILVGMQALCEKMQAFIEHAGKPEKKERSPVAYLFFALSLLAVRILIKIFWNG